MGHEMTALVVEPEKEPYVKSIPTGLASLQQEVGGYIQAIYPWADDPCAIICDEEAKLKHSQGNLGHATAAFTLDVYGHVTDKMKEESAARMENFIKSVSEG